MAQRSKIRRAERKLNRSWLDQSHYLSFPPLHFRRIATNRVTTAIPFSFFFFKHPWDERMISQEAHSLLIRAWHGRLLFQGCLSIIPSTRNRNSKPMLARIFATGQVIRTFLPFSPFFTLFFSSSPLFLPLFPSVSKRAKTAKCAVKQTSRERRGEKWNFQRRRSVETGQMGFRSTQMTGALIAFLLLFSPPPSSSSSGPARVICSVPTVVCAR